MRAMSRLYHRYLLIASFYNSSLEISCRLILYAGKIIRFIIFREIINFHYKNSNEQRLLTAAVPSLWKPDIDVLLPTDSRIVPRHTRHKRLDACFSNHHFVHEEREIRLVPIAQISQLKTHWHRKSLGCEREPVGEVAEEENKPSAEWRPTWSLKS